MGSIEFEMAEIAQAVCRSVISDYAVVGKLEREDEPNEFGVSVMYGQGNNDGKILFSFVTERDYLIRVSMDARVYVLKPSESVYNLHNEIRKKINEKFDAEAPAILLPRGKVAPAVEGIITPVEEKVLGGFVPQIIH